MRFVLKPITRLISQINPDKPIIYAPLILLRQNSPFCSDTDTTASIKQSNNPRFTFSQKWHNIDNTYQQLKGRYKTSSALFEFLLEKGLFALAIAFLGNEAKDYLETRNYLTTIQLAIDQQAVENTALLESKRALAIQPKLYLTTVITYKDLEEHQQNQADFNHRLQQFTDYQNQVNQLISKLAHWSHFYINKQLSQALNNLLGTLILQLEQLEIAKQLDKSIWLQKTCQYHLALSKLEQNVIAKLETLSASKLNTQRLLIAAYNAQAKLYACLSKTSQTPSEERKYSDASLTSYEKAVALSNPDLGIEHAILLSSLAYLHNDRNEPEKALALRQQALAFKPNDEHILCGMGLDIHHIEQKKAKEERNNVQLDLAYGYFSKALLINDREPNIFVSRGFLLLNTGHIQEALKDFEQALKLNPKHTEANLHKAKCLISQNECQAAEICVRLSLTTQVENSAALQKTRQSIIDYQKIAKANCQLQKLSFFNPTDQKTNKTLNRNEAENKPKSSDSMCRIC